MTQSHRNEDLNSIHEVASLLSDFERARLVEKLHGLTPDEKRAELVALSRTRSSVADRRNNGILDQFPN